MAESSKSTTTGSDSADKRTKRELKILQEEARAAFEAGDYQLTRQLYEQVKTADSSGATGTAAAKELASFKLAPFTARVGLAATVLYALAWALSLR